MPYKSIKTNGFTLIELLVAIALIGIMSIVIDDLFLTTWSSFRYTNDGLAAEQETRTASEKILVDLRQATAINTISSSSITFYRLFGNDTIPTKMEISLSGSQLNYSKTTPSGTPPNVTYPVTNKTTQIIATHLVNTTNVIFVPYDASNQPLPYSSIGSIKMVKLILMADIDPQKDPTAFRLETNVQLRNFKIN